MKCYRVILSALLLSAILLNSLPDSLLDMFHQHEHAHDCAPPEDDDHAQHFEAEHIHCTLPDLYFPFAEAPAEHPGILLSEVSVIHKVPAPAVSKAASRILPGRAPPSRS